jgi:hypothetical protein
MSNIHALQQPQPEPLTFDDFWLAYPKRVGKPLARAKWEAIVNGGLTTRTLDKDSGTYVAITLEATAQELVDGAKRYAKSQIDPNTYGLKDGGRFTLHPSTWLNQGRWEDFI